MQATTRLPRCGTHFQSIRPLLTSMLAATLLAAIPLAGASAKPAPASFPSFSIRNLGTLPHGLDAEAFGLNDDGQVVGYGYTVFKRGRKTVATTHAFLFSGGALHDLGAPPGAGASYGYGINASGLMVAAVLAGRTERPYAVRFRRGKVTWTALPGVGGTKAGVALGVNDSGTAAGWLNGRGATMWRTQDNPVKAVSLRSSGNAQATAIDSQVDVAGFDSIGSKQATFWPAGGSKMTLPGLGASGSQARGLAQTGSHDVIVVGSATTRQHAERATLWHLSRTGSHWSASGAGNLGVLSASEDSRAYAANPAGWVVGYSFSRTAFHAFLWKSGVLRALNDLIPRGSGWDLTWATAVNAKGQIAGWGTYHGAERPFLLTPR